MVAGAAIERIAQLRRGRRRWTPRCWRRSRCASAGVRRARRATRRGAHRPRIGAWAAWPARMTPRWPERADNPAVDAARAGRVHLPLRRVGALRRPVPADGRRDARDRGRSVAHLLARPAGPGPPARRWGGSTRTRGRDRRDRSAPRVPVGPPGVEPAVGAPRALLARDRRHGRPGGGERRPSRALTATAIARRAGRCGSGVDGAGAGGPRARRLLQEVGDLERVVGDLEALALGLLQRDRRPRGLDRLAAAGGRRRRLGRVAALGALAAAVPGGVGVALRRRRRPRSRWR